MATVRLIIEIAAIRPRDCKALADEIIDRADTAFEDYTMHVERPMTLRSWIERPRAPKPTGKDLKAA